VIIDDEEAFGNDDVDDDDVKAFCASGKPMEFFIPVLGLATTTEGSFCAEAEVFARELGSVLELLIGISSIFILSLNPPSAGE